MNIRFKCVAFAMLLAACGGGNATAPAKAPTLPPMVEPAQATSAPAQKQPEALPTLSAAGGQTQNPRQAPTALPAQVGTAQAPVVIPTASAGEPSVLGELNSNLDALKSYRLKWVMAWDGTNKDGKPQKGSFSLFQEFIAATKDQHMQWVSTKNSAAEETFEVFNIGQEYYMYSPGKTGDEKCIAGSGAGMEGAGSLLEPWDFFGRMKNARLVKKGETVNGILTDHYQVDEKSAGVAGFTSGSGDIWVAQDGKYTVKYSGKFSGKGGVLDADMVDGVVTWNYDLNDVNKVAAIAPPADCKKPGTSLPLPDDASEKTSMMSMTMFKTRLDAAGVVAFYKTKLAALGYKVQSENVMGDTATISMTKDKTTVTVMVSKDNGMSQVIIQEGP